MSSTLHNHKPLPVQERTVELRKRLPGGCAAVVLIEKLYAHSPDESREV